MKELKASSSCLKSVNLLPYHTQYNVANAEVYFSFDCVDQNKLEASASILVCVHLSCVTLPSHLHT